MIVRTLEEVAGTELDVRGDGWRARRLLVRDDGIGGARPVSGSGLCGLADRMEAVGGTLTVESPPGGGTRVRAHAPRATAAA